MRVAFRVDASLQIGTGHVMRCLTLADELHRQGADATFLCRGEPGNLIALIKPLGHDVRVLPSAADDADASAQALAQIRPDWVVVDHYSLDQSWERAVRPPAARIFAIDDLANRDHDCDLLLDQNLYDGVERLYAARVPAHCRQLIGPRYALLRPEFAALRSTIARTARPVTRLLVSFGGVDSTNETARVLDPLFELAPAASIDVVLGPSNPHIDAVKVLAARRSGATVHVGTNRMAELMSLADAFVGAGGSTTWERFCLGLPSLVIATADNQVPTAQYLGKRGAMDYIGTASSLTDDALKAALLRFLMDHERRLRMVELGMELVDGLGTTRVAACLLDPARG